DGVYRGDSAVVWMAPCLDDEGCGLLVNQSGWTCTQPGGRVKTTTDSTSDCLAGKQIESQRRSAEWADRRKTMAVFTRGSERAFIRAQKERSEEQLTF
ncbi:Chemokine-like protein TAFA-5, partial [Dissostichus eleginoides]